MTGDDDDYDRSKWSTSGVDKDGWPKDRADPEDWTTRDLRILEQAWKGGSFTALYDAVALCIKRSLPLPAWAGPMVLSGLKAYRDYAPYSDGKGRPGKLSWRVERDRAHFLRYEMVDTLLNRDNVPWKNVFEDASNALKGTEAAGAPDTIRSSYNRVRRAIETSTDTLRYYISTTARQGAKKTD